MLRPFPMPAADNTRSNRKKRAERIRPGIFPAYFTIFAEGPQDKLQIRDHCETLLCQYALFEEKRAKKGTERRRHASSVPSLQPHYAIAANYFLLKMDMMSTKSLSSTIGLLSSDGEEEDSRGAE